MFEGTILEKRKFIKAKEAADILGVSPSTILRWCREGKFSYSKPGRAYLVVSEDIKKVMYKHTHKKRESGERIPS
jgi:excisionase family DNA binding protein